MFKQLVFYSFNAACNTTISNSICSVARVVVTVIVVKNYAFISCISFTFSLINVNITYLLLGGFELFCQDPFRNNVSKHCGFPSFL